MQESTEWTWPCLRKERLLFLKHYRMWKFVSHFTVQNFPSKLNHVYKKGESRKYLLASSAEHQSHCSVRFIMWLLFLISVCFDICCSFPPLCSSEYSQVKQTWLIASAFSVLYCCSNVFSSILIVFFHAHVLFCPSPCMSLKTEEGESGEVRYRALYAPVKPNRVLANGMQAHNALHSSNSRRQNSFDSVECPALGALSSSAACLPPSPFSSPDTIYLEIYAEMCC